MGEQFNDFKADLIMTLLSYPSITNVLGDRIYPEIAPADAVMPYVVCVVRSMNNERALARSGNISFVNFQLDIWSPTSALCWNVHNTILNEIEHQEIPNGNIHAIMLENAFDAQGELLLGAEKGEQRVIATFDCSYEARV